MVELQSRARGSRKAMFVFVGAAVLVSGILSMPWLRRSIPVIPAGQRQVMPSLTLKQLDGDTWRLADHRGQAVLINYWATWCAPCRSETPGLVRLADEERARGLAVVGISMDTGNREVVRSFVRQMRVGYPVTFPEPMSQMAAGMVGLPTTILVDRQGRVAKTYVGETREAEFRADLDKVLGE